MNESNNIVTNSKTLCRREINANMYSQIEDLNYYEKLYENIYLIKIKNNMSKDEFEENLKICFEKCGSHCDAISGYFDEVKNNLNILNKKEYYAKLAYSSEILYQYFMFLTPFDSDNEYNFIRIAKGIKLLQNDILEGISDNEKISWPYFNVKSESLGVEKFSLEVSYIKISNKKNISFISYRFKISQAEKEDNEDIKKIDKIFEDLRKTNISNSKIHGYGYIDQKLNEALKISLKYDNLIDRQLKIYNAIIKNYFTRINGLEGKEKIKIEDLIEISNKNFFHCTKMYNLLMESFNLEDEFDYYANMKFQYINYIRNMMTGLSLYGTIYKSYCDSPTNKDKKIYIEVLNNRKILQEHFFSMMANEKLNNYISHKSILDYILLNNKQELIYSECRGTNNSSSKKHNKSRNQQQFKNSNSYSKEEIKALNVAAKKNANELINEEESNHKKHISRKHKSTLNIVKDIKLKTTKPANHDLISQKVLISKKKSKVSPSIIYKNVVTSLIDNINEKKTDPNISSLIEQAKKLSKVGEFYNAIDLCNKYIANKEQPTNYYNIARLRIYIGECYLSKSLCTVADFAKGRSEFVYIIESINEFIEYYIDLNKYLSENKASIDNDIIESFILPINKIKLLLKNLSNERRTKNLDLSKIFKFNYEIIEIEESINKVRLSKIEEFFKSYKGLLTLVKHKESHSLSKEPENIIYYEIHMGKTHCSEALKKLDKTNNCDETILNIYSILDIIIESIEHYKKAMSLLYVSKITIANRKEIEEIIKLGASNIESLNNIYRNKHSNHNIEIDRYAEKIVFGEKFCELLNLLKKSENVTHSNSFQSKIISSSRLQNRSSLIMI